MHEHPPTHTHTHTRPPPHLVRPRGETHPHRVGGNQAREVDQVQQGGLQQLTNDERARDGDECDAGKRNRALFQGRHHL